MRRTLFILPLLLLAACDAQLPDPGARTTVTTTYATERVPIATLGDSVAGPAPAGVSKRLVTDSANASGGAARQATAADSTDFCAATLRDPVSGVRWMRSRTLVRTVTTHADPTSTLRRLYGWGDYLPAGDAPKGLAPGQRLRVDCATYAVAGIAPDSAAR